MLTRQGTGHRHQRVVAIFVAMIVVGAAGCAVREQADKRLNNLDRKNFTSSAESFTKAHDAFAFVVKADNANPNPSGFAAAAQPSVDGMRHAAAQMGTLADKVTGDAHTIANTAWEAATGMVSAANKLVVGVAANDVDTIQAANKDGESSRAEFNKQRTAWNAL